MAKRADRHETGNGFSEQYAHSGFGRRAEGDTAISERPPRSDCFVPTVWAGQADVAYVREFRLA